MLKAFRDLLSGNLSQDQRSETRGARDDSVAEATTALLSQMVRADFEVKDREREQMQSGVRKLLDLNDQEADELIRAGEAKAAESVSLYDFTQVLHAQLDPEQKVEIIELLWGIGFADGELDSQEEFLVRKVARLLHVPHPDFIAAKQRARAAYLADSGSRSA